MRIRTVTLVFCLAVSLFPTGIALAEPQTPYEWRTDPVATA